MFYSVALHAQNTNTCISIDTNLCYASQPYPVVDFAIEKKFESIDETAVYQSPLLADIDGDCVPEIIMAGTTGFTTSPRLTSGIRIINSLNGQNMINIPTAFYSWHAGSSFAVADIDFDGVPEIIIAIADHNLNPVNLRGRIVCYDLTGNINWISNTQFGANSTYRYGGTIGIADFNQDGIPEVYIYNEIFNAQNGVKLCDGGSNGLGLGPENVNQGTGSVVIAANLDDDMTDLELAAGYTIYKVSINNPSGIAGNNMTPYNIAIDGIFHDGFTSIGDVNNDGVIDVICAVRGNMNNSKLYTYFLTNNNPVLIAQTTPVNANQNNSINIGPPFVGDIDGSGTVSIGVTRPFLLLTYKFNGTNNLLPFWQITTNDGSGETGLTMFDFNQDGIQEIVYRDETNLRIINGSVNPPLNLATFSCSSGTGIEHPIVGDIDNSGESKICVSCGVNSGTVGKISVFGAPTGQQPWAPSRGIWNQYAYHVFNINDDLTIPAQQLNNATYANGAYNNFYVQASLLDENDNFLQQVPDLGGEIECVNYDWNTNEYTVSFSISNGPNASLSAPSGISVAFFDGNPQTNGNLLGTSITTAPINQGDTLNNLSFTFTSSNLTELYMVVNAVGSFTGATYTDNDFTILECGYTNNIISTQNLPLIEELSDTICANQTFNYYNTLYDESGVYLFTAQNTNGCDSLVSKLNLVVHPVYSFSETLSSCDSYTWPVNGQTYTNSGVYTEVLQTQFGCDSTIILDLIINESTISTEQLSSCNEFTWPVNGQTYTSSGIYTEVLQTQFGCDSTLILELTINESVIITETLSACDSYTWSVNGQTYTDSGTYTEFLQTQFGCDSILVLELTINESITTNETQSSCDTYTWPVNGQTYTNSGVYTEVLQTQFGCDSTLVLELAINESVSSTETLFVCDTYTWPVSGQTYMSSGTYTEILQTQFGCDSTLILELTINESITSTETLSVCDSYTWPVNGQTYTSSGTYTEVLQTQFGCDSTVNLNLTIYLSNSSQTQVTSCDNFIWNGQTYNQSGIYSYQTINMNGCDSLATLNLTINNSVQTQELVRVCNFEDEKEEVFELSTIHGCDSTHIVIYERYPLSQLPVASFSTAPTSTVMLPPGIIQTFNSSQNATTYLWNFGDGSALAAETNPTHTYQNEGQYEIKLVANNGTNCADTSIQFIIVQEDLLIYVPNAFTPDGDNFNDVFLPIINGDFDPYNYTLLIFNRWGEVVFESRNAQIAWDGTYGGKTVQDGTYIWKIRLQSKLNDEPMEFVGHVSVLR